MQCVYQVGTIGKVPDLPLIAFADKVHRNLLGNHIGVAPEISDVAVGIPKAPGGFPVKGHMDHRRVHSILGMLRIAYI